MTQLIHIQKSSCLGFFYPEEKTEEVLVEKSCDLFLFLFFFLQAAHGF